MTRPFYHPPPPHLPSGTTAPSHSLRCPHPQCAWRLSSTRPSSHYSVGGHSQGRPHRGRFNVHFSFLVFGDFRLIPALINFFFSQRSSEPFPRSKAPLSALCFERRAPVAACSEQRLPQGSKFSLTKMNFHSGSLG